MGWLATGPILPRLATVKVSIYEAAQYISAQSPSFPSCVVLIVGVRPFPVESEDQSDKGKRPVRDSTKNRTRRRRRRDLILATLGEENNSCLYSNLELFVRLSREKFSPISIDPWLPNSPPPQ